MKTRKAFKIIAAATLVAVVFAATGGTLVYFAVTAGAEFDENALPDSYTTSTVLAADNTLIKSSATMSGIQPDAIPRNLGAAFVAAEDKRFYNHRGIDYIRIAGAALKDIKKRSFAEGGSTISQQLIKNTHLSREKTLERKLKELKLATKLEKKFDKNEILAMYLNVLYFGGGIYGVNQASEELLGKTPEELTVAECAMLAAIIKNPAGYSPVNHPEACKNRRNLILKLMLDQEYIGEKEYAAACASPLGIKTAQKDYAELYVNSVYAEAADKLGITPSAVKNGGYEIQTYYLQSKQKALYENLHDGNLYAPGDNATYGAAIMCDNASKGISAYYSIDNTLAGQMRRQGASVVKPLLVYAPAMETGAVSPATQIMDEPVDFGGYAPENYGKNYSGRISVRQAVKESSNVSAVKVMTYITPEKAAEYAEKMNISLTDEDKNLTLALGSTRNGFTLNELAGGYLTLANRGEYLTPQFIKSIKKNGKTLYERKTDSVRVFSDSTAYLMTDILKDTATDGTAKALRVLGIPIAAKTGTASVNGKNTDAWCASYTTEDTLIVWHGSKNYSSETAMPSSETGGAFATKTAAAIYKEVYGGRILSDFVMSADTVMLKLDKTDLENQKITLASEQTPLRYTVSELFDIRYAPDTVSLNFTELKVANLRLSPYPGGCTVQFEAKPFLEYEICKNNILGDRILYTVTEGDGDVSVNIEDNNLNDYYIKVGFINDSGQKICGEHQYLTENDENNSHYKENKKNRPKFFGLF